jgi:hypothetical protein
MFSQYNLDDRKQGKSPNKYDYNFILPKHLHLMYNSACSWFGDITLIEKASYVSSTNFFGFDNTSLSAYYPHVKVDMSRCNEYNDSFDDEAGAFGLFNYNFAFLNVDNFIWPKSNEDWTYINDDMFEDSQIKCNMDLRGLKNLTTIGHWGCGR